MKHLTEEELFAYREGETTQREAIAEHLTNCAECSAELERLEAVLRALDHLPVPERGPEYGRAVWQQIAPRLPEKAGRGWRAWFEPRRLLAFGTVAAMVVLAFVAGRWTKTKEPGGTGTPAASVAQVRQRVLVVAVGEHLGKSEMVLMELANAAPANSGQREINISAEQRRAEDLLDSNRLYRETALHDGDAALASVLDDLERVLMDVAHSPDQLTPAKLEALQKRIEAHGILFKVRVVGQELQEKQKATVPAPAITGLDTREGNKA
ncbi:MAG: anti-sigma factor family protein [Candidatus Acidiferrum sp.]